MFGLFKKRNVPDLGPIRDLLFGDVPLTDWRTQDGSGATAEPWSSFEAARVALQAHDTDGAVAALRRVADAPGLESRQYLQAWHSLRQLGIEPGVGEGKRVRGVVLEVHLRSGLDTLAAYADGTARYLNHGGKLIVWEHSDAAIGKAIVDLLQSGQRVVDVIGPWKEPRRGPPPKQHGRINMLTASGLHFGEGPLSVLTREPMAAPVFAAGTVLMQLLIQRCAASQA